MVQMLCLDWAGLDWGLLDYYSRDTASRMKTTHFKKYLHLHGIIDVTPCPN